MKKTAQRPQQRRPSSSAEINDAFYLFIEHVIQRRLLQSIPSRPPMTRKRAGKIFIIMIDTESIFSPPETPAKCT